VKVVFFNCTCKQRP